MIIRFAVCLLVTGAFTACESTTTTKRETVGEMTARYASNESMPQPNEPVPPAEGPEDADGNLDPNQNPALLPTPLLRESAASSQ